MGGCPARTGDLLLVSSIRVGVVACGGVRFAHFATTLASRGAAQAATFRSCLLPACSLSG